jgi:hypothetical protein
MWMKNAVIFSVENVLIFLHKKKLIKLELKKELYM